MSRKAGKCSPNGPDKKLLENVGHFEKVEQLLLIRGKFERARFTQLVWKWNGTFGVAFELDEGTALIERS